MKKVLLSVMWSIIFPLYLFAQDQSGIIFQRADNWNEVLARAKTEHKYIFVDIFTTWCRPCKMMDYDVYPDEQLGKLINEKFISIKVQMDSSKNDDAYIKSWYHDAAMLGRSANIEAYPTLLFYSPDGELLMRTIGYKDAIAVVTIASFASNAKVAKQFNDDLTAYKDGKREYEKMVSLSRTVKQILQDNKLATQIAKDYKAGYLDKLADIEFYKIDNLKFIRENDLNLVNVNDRFFNLCYFQPERIDTLFGSGLAHNYVLATIAKDEVKSKLYAGDKPVSKSPDWKRIEKHIAACYKKINAKDFVADQKMAYYFKVKDWETYTTLRSQNIREKPPKPYTDDVFFRLNVAAYDVFEQCSDTISLKRALAWSDLSIQLEDNVQYLDTKANLLYKLKRVKEAIQLQEKALIRDREEAQKMGKEFIYSYISENLEKMRKGEATWIVNQ